MGAGFDFLGTDPLPGQDERQERKEEGADTEQLAAAGRPTTRPDNRSDYAGGGSGGIEGWILNVIGRDAEQHYQAQRQQQ